MVSGKWWPLSQKATLYTGGSNTHFSTNYNFVHSILKHFIEVVQGGGGRLRG